MPPPRFWTGDDEDEAFDAGGLFVADAGLLDPEHPHSARSRGLQCLLFREADRGSAYAERIRARLEGRWRDDARLADLQHKRCEHSWLWALCPAHGASLDPSEYTDAVRLRLGAPLVSDSCTCHRCGALVQPDGVHTQTCGGAGEVVGHNRVRDSLHALAALADPSAALETPGLIPSRPKHRPADVLTYAAGLAGGCSALDVGVTTPWSTGAGDDCARAMRDAKLTKARPWIEELRAEGVDYVPMGVSCFGRWEEGAHCIIVALARRAARRAGIASHAAILRRARCRLAVEVVRRSVSCLRSCLVRDVAALLEGGGL